jgi:hypothetical protein
MWDTSKQLATDVEVPQQVNSSPATTFPQALLGKQPS